VVEISAFSFDAFPLTVWLGAIDVPRVPVLLVLLPIRTLIPNRGSAYLTPHASVLELRNTVSWGARVFKVYTFEGIEA